MIDNTEAAVLGFIQGMTEYLPVSSSGHLVIAQNLFGLKEPALFFDIVLHLGTLVAIAGYYRADIANAASETISGISDVSATGGLFKIPAWKEAFGKRPGFWLVFLVIIGSIPTGLLGVGFKDEFESMFGSVRWVGTMLFITGAIMFLTRFTKSGGRETGGIRWWEAAAIGLAQGMAITPGISRSGTTIAVALFLGIERETAAKFSFLLFIPAIFGAVILGMDFGANDVTALALAIGFFASLFVGYACLALLVNFVRNGRLSWFSYYCFAAGGFTIFYLG